MTKQLATVVLAELALAVLRAVLVLGERGAAAGEARTAGDGGATRPAAAAGATADTNDAAHGSAQAPQAALAATRQDAGAWRADDPIGVLLQGSVRWRDGGPVAGATLAAERGDAVRRATADRDGRFAVVGLAPGEWQVSVSALGAADAVAALAVTHDAVQGFDAVLDRSFAVDVRATTLDGADLLAAVRGKLGTRAALVAIARREAIPDRVAAGDGGGTYEGEGRWQPALTAADGALGTIHLPFAPPCHTALLLQNVVLARQQLQPGQRDVAFAVDVATIGTLTGSLRARVLDAATGEPLKARVAVSTAPGPNQVLMTDAEGRVKFDVLRPGPLRCTAFAIGRETFETVLSPEPGAAIELGDVRLGTEARLHGRVVDEYGGPANAALQWTDLKWRTKPVPFGATRTSRANADGTFELHGSGPGAIALSATTSDGRIAAGVFDNPPAGPIELRLSRACRLAVTSGGDPARSCTLTMLDATRRPVGAWFVGPRRSALQVSMPAGSYAFEVHDEQHRLVHSGTIELSATPASLRVP